MTYRDEVTAILDAHDAESADVEKALADTRTLLDTERAADKTEDAAYEAKIVQLTAEKAALERKLGTVTGALEGWSPFFEDQFLNLNTVDNWSVKNNTYASNEHSYLLAANVSASNGLLNIVGKKEAVGGRQWTSGYLKSKRALPNYFRSEVRAMLTWEQGMWCAPLWHRPWNSLGAYEIDLCENWAKYEPKVHQTLHAGSAYTSPAHKHAEALFDLPSPYEYHTYVVEKTRNLVTFYLDGVVKKRFTSSDSMFAADWATGFEANLTWDMRINMQIGDNMSAQYTGGDPDATTDWSKTTMKVDYVKAWQLA